MGRDMNRVLIETTVRRTLKEINEAPERGIRNLIDLGLSVSKGRFQQNFLTTAQQMLRNEDSAYYTLIKDVLTNVDPEHLATFGVNLGYNSCTKGAKRIRAIEAERGFSVPWSLSVYLNEEKQAAQPEFYPALLQQATELGIFTHSLFTKDNPALAIPLMKTQPECAFLLFVEGEQVTQALLDALRPVKNAMVVVRVGAALLPACEALRKAKMLYGAYTMYTEDDKQAILSGAWLAGVGKARPAFAFLVADRVCPDEAQREVYAYVLSVRDGQQHPVFLMEAKRDMLRIDKIISDDVCMAGFGYYGRLLTHEGIHLDPQLNIFENPLEDILRRRMGMGR